MVHAPRIGLDRTVLFIRTPRLECRICQRVLNAVLPLVAPQMQLHQEPGEAGGGSAKDDDDS